MKRRHTVTAAVILAAPLLTAACADTPGAAADNVGNGAEHGAPSALASGTVTGRTSAPSNAAEAHDPRAASQTSANLGGAPAGVRIDPADIDAFDAGQVATAAAAAINTVDTATDTSSDDAYRRAAPWLADRLLSGMLTAPEPVGADWLALAAHDGYTVVTDLTLAPEYGQPDNTTETAYETVTYRIHTIHRDHTTPPATRTGTAHMRLTNTPAGWKIEAFE